AYDRRWADEPGLGDWWGRALWGLGTAAAHSPAPWIRNEALLAFTLGATQRSPALRAMAFAGLGAAEVLRSQPDDSAAASLLADACATAAAVTDDRSWETGIRQATAWFLGANDAGTPMWDPATGGGYDGLTPHGPNLNQGAESTLALLSTLQHARRLSRPCAA